MKTLKYIFCSLIFVSSVAFATSCKDDGGGNGNGNGGNIQTGWTENGNTLIYTTVSGTGISEIVAVWTLTFEEDLCVKARLEVTFSSANIAVAAYNELDDEEKDIATLSGKKIMFNFDDDYAGLSKELIKAAIESGVGGGWL